MKKIFKVLIDGVLLFLIYKGTYIYSLLKFADHMRDCLPQSQVCNLAKLNAPLLEVAQTMKKTLVCVEQKQGVIESLVLKVPLEDSFVAENLEPASQLIIKNCWRCARIGLRNLKTNNVSLAAVYEPKLLVKAEALVC